MMLRRSVFALGAVLVLGLLASSACASPSGDSPASAAVSQGDGQWSLSSQSPDVIAAYLFVSDHRHEARQIPCYCGCAGLGHHSLADCFLKPAGGYEEHASGCQVCGNEANDLKRFLHQGQDIRAARSYIDTTYARLGKPTDTPQP